MEKIQIKYFTDKIEPLTYVDGKSDWIDLRAAEEVVLKAGEFKLIPLGVAMRLPKGYEAHVVPRSSTFKNYGIIQTNHFGVIDETYSGDNDQWFMPVYAVRDTQIHVNDRICQFVSWSISRPLCLSRWKSWTVQTAEVLEVPAKHRKESIPLPVSGSGFVGV